MRGRDGSARVADALRATSPALDDLRRARMERRLLDQHQLKAAHDHLKQTTGQVSPGDAEQVVSPGARARAAWAAGGAVVALAAALALTWITWPREGPEVARFELTGTSTASGTIDVGRELAFGEGEHARVQVGGVGIEVAGDPTTAPSGTVATGRTAMRFVSLDTRHVEVELTEGTIDVAFHPRERGRERLSIDTPSARVEVVGTEFSVRLEGGTTQVSVRHGVVRVIPHASAQRAVLVHAGEHVAVDEHGTTEGREASARPAAAIEPARIDDAPSDTQLISDTSSIAPSVEVRPVFAPDVVVAPAITPEITPELVPGALGENGAPAEVPAVVEAPAQPSPAQRLAAARLVLGQGHHARARRLLAELIRASDTPLPVRLGAQTELGDSYFSSGEWDRAVEEYERAATFGRGHPLGDAAILALARAHQRRGDTEAVRRTYLRYVEEAPRGANASTVRQWVCSHGGDPSVDCGGGTR